LIFVTAGRLLGLSNRATRMKRLIGQPQKALRESKAAVTKRLVGTEINHTLWWWD